MGSYYLFTNRLHGYQMLPALSCGFFSIGVLNVNNIRDIESDGKAGKFSIPVRIGRANAVRYHWFLIFAGIISAIVYNVTDAHFAVAMVIFAKRPIVYSEMDWP